MPKRGQTTPEERKQFIEEQRASRAAYTGKGRYLSADMSFIDRDGNIVRPSRDEYHESIRRKKEYETNRDDPRYRPTSAIITIISLLGSIFFLSFSFLNKTIYFSPGATTFNWQLLTGVILLLIGLSSGLFWMKSKKIKKKK